MERRSFCISLYVLIAIVFVTSCKKDDVNIAPQIETQVFYVDENSTEGTVVGKVIATDEDEGQRLSYAIIGGNTDGAFVISEDDGTISVSNEDMMDFEVYSNFTLDIKVSDDKYKSSNAQIVVVLNNMEISPLGLQLYMPFDGDVLDKSLNYNHGIDNTSNVYVDGVKSKALDFNGVTDFVKLSKTMESYKGLSFSFWLKTRGAYDGQNNGAVVSKYDMGGNRCFIIGSFDVKDGDCANRLSAAFYKYGYSSNIHDHVKSYMPEEYLAEFEDQSFWKISKQKKLEKNKWTHCVVNVSEEFIETWLDGELCIKKQRQYQTYYRNVYEPVIIGNINNGGVGSNNHLNGVLDELRIYNRPLAETEIRTLFKE